MAVTAQRKGKRAEREFANLLTDQLGRPVARNLMQTAEGGADILGIGAWAIECKRQERLALGVWWEQCCRQAYPGHYPALAYRLSRQPWRIIVPLDVICGRPAPDQDFRDCLQATLGMAGFCSLAATNSEAMAGHLA